MTGLAGMAVTTCAIAILSSLSPEGAQSGSAGLPMPGHHMAAPGPETQPGTSPEGMPMKHHQMTQMTSDMPTLPGQHAFGALQEIVRNP